MLNQFCAWGSGWGRSLGGDRRRYHRPMAGLSPSGMILRGSKLLGECEGAPPPYHEVSGKQVNEMVQDTGAGRSETGRGKGHL